MVLYEHEKEHIKALRKLTAECTLFLRRNGDFPLKSAGDIALFGSGARNTLKGGTGSGDVNSRYYVSAEKGLKNAGFNITSTQWMDSYDEVYSAAKKLFFVQVKAEAKKAKQNPIFFGMGAVMPEPEYDFPLDYPGDACIYVVSRICGEGNDRKAVKGDIFLSDTEIRDIKALNSRFNKFLLVLNVGGPIDLSDIPEVENVLLLSQLGVDTGNVLAAIILGKLNPSGKLTTTWADWKDYPTVGEFGEENDTRYNEGIYVGYRYFDSVGIKAAYPFGYGMSYTSFSITRPRITLNSSKVTASAYIKNTGDYAGKEVMQVYVSAPDGKLDKPYQTLAAFAKTKELKAGAMEAVDISFDIKELASYDTENAQYILEAGDYIVRIGNSSADTTVAGAITIKETLVVKQVKNVLGQTDFEDFVAVKPDRPAEEYKSIELDSSVISCESTDYDSSYATLIETEEYSDEELAYINIGAFSDGKDVASIIGSAGTTVAGAAGETTSKLKCYDVPNLVMADGPAGLRLTRNYTEADGSQFNVDPPLVGDVLELMNPAEKALIRLSTLKNKKGEVKHHYATAIPIGTAIAQSWNVELAESCGDIVGEEMEMYGIHLWLAPALNIHRDIRCGRNFEYYSEDPLISGKMASAITRGVQKHPGCATTIKHYAANNQEYNRYNNNSCVSERAMREIYLKGFEIAVKDSQPRTIMTSYNLLNGTHTSEHRGLIEDILRCEWGFEGLVMTDWVITNGMMGKNPYYPAPVAYKVAAAGGDLFMPGSRREFDNICEAIANGAISREQLCINATRTINLARELSNNHK